MRNAKRVLIAWLIAGIMMIAFVATNEVYGATKVLKATQYRPYSGSQIYEVQRAARQTVFKIYEKGTESGEIPFPDAIYCVRAGLGFGDGESANNSDVEYEFIGDWRTDKDKIRTRFQDITGTAITELDYDSILWIIDQMYLPRHKAYGTDGKYNREKSELEQKEMKENLLTEAFLKYYRENENYDSETELWKKARAIEDAKETKLTDDDIEVIQQVAIWYFSNFDQNGEGNSLSLPLAATLSNLILINGVNNNLILPQRYKDEIDRLYKYLVDGAIENSDEIVEVPDLKFYPTNPEIIERSINFPPTLEYYIVGPFELVNYGGDNYTINKITVQSRHSTGFPKTIEIDNELGTVFITDASMTQDLRFNDVQLMDMVNEGEFYLAIQKRFYNNMQELSIDIEYFYWETKTADYMDAGEDNQPVVLIEKEKVHRRERVTTEIIEGKFDLELRKINEEGNLIVSDSAVFTIRRIPGLGSTYYTTSNNATDGDVTGKIVISDIEIMQEDEEFIYEIEEVKTPAGHDGIVGKFFIRARTERVENEYKLKTVELVKPEGNGYVSTAVEGVRVNLSSDRTTIQLEVENKLKPEGEFNLEIRKVDEEGNLILSDTASFNIRNVLEENGELYYTTSDYTSDGEVTGKIRIAEIPILQADEVFVYEIEEVKSPIGYDRVSEQFYLAITTERVSNSFRIKEAEIMKYESGRYVSAEIEGVTLRLTDSNSTLQIFVENKQSKEFDLSLRKSITNVNGTAINERIPELDLSELRAKSATTATYIHPKTPISVRQGDVVIYTIRVYNEGDMDGYVSEITDYIPEGLGFLTNHKVNYENGWKIPTESKVVSLVGEDGLYEDESKVKNIKLSDFNETSSLEEIKIISGKSAVTTNILRRDALAPTANVIKAYERNKNVTYTGAGDLWQKTGEIGYEDGLYYREVEIACIVLSENSYSGLLRNTAEITEAQDYNGHNVEDRDSIPDNVNITVYYPPEDNSEYQEDDDDYEQLRLKYFEMHLRKFITKVDDEHITSRRPQVKINDEDELVYTHPKDPIHVANGQVVTYTIRVYNAGTIAGYAEEVRDNIPAGLEYLPNHEINEQYEWKMYYVENDELIETDDPLKATEVRTRYLSEASETTARSNEMQPFDASKPITDSNPDYRDVEVAFKVVEPQEKEYSQRIVINTAEITETSEEDDGDPDKKKDREYIYVKYFELEIIKWVSKTLVTVDGQTVTTNYNMPTDDPGSGYIVKVDVDKQAKTIVEFVYTIKVANKGEIGGYVTEITDIIPEGLEFIAEDNPLWIKAGENTAITRALENAFLEPGDSTTVDIKFKWTGNGENIGTKRNVAEITEYYNEYGAEDPKPHQDDALVLLAIRTGSPLIYIPAIIMVLTMLTGGVYLVKKYVLIY